MAFIADDDKLLDPNAPQADGGGGPSFVGGGSNDVGGGVSTAGVGAGGTGGWTNIQAYLGANKGDTGSAQALDKTVSGQFDKEKSAYTQDSSKFLGDAQAKVNADKIDNSKADELINQAKSSYSYGNDPADTTKKDSYQQTVGKVQGALNGAYTGPKEYNYGFNNQTQEYGNSLKDQTGGFDQLMGHIYQNAAGSPLASGQLNLQKQLDVNNENLVNTRKNLATKYDQLGADRDKVVGDTTSGLSALEQQYRQNQNSLKDYLGQKSNSYDQEIGQAEADARSAYNDTFTNDRSGKSSIGFDSIAASKAEAAKRLRESLGIWGKDLSWQQLQREQDNRTLNRGYGKENLWYGEEPEWNRRAQEMQSFYGDQNEKYKDTADEQERAFNSIQDFLNSNAARKEQGFKVRG